MGMIKKVLLKAINILSILIIVCAVATLMVVVLTPKGQVPNLFGYSFFRVMTGSMEPEIPVNSMIVVEKVDSRELEIGDVISFFSRDPSLYGEVNTHRILEIEEQDGELVFLTKGDANNVSDQYLTLEEDIIGRVVWVSLFIGKLVRLASNPLFFIPCIMIPLVVLLGRNLWESIKLAKQLAREEEEKAVREAIEEIRKRKAEEKSQSDGIETEERTE